MVSFINNPSYKSGCSVSLDSVDFELGSVVSNCGNTIVDGFINLNIKVFKGIIQLLINQEIKK